MSITMFYSTIDSAASPGNVWIQLKAQAPPQEVDSIQLVTQAAFENTDSNQLMIEVENHSIRISSEPSPCLQSTM